MWPDPVSNPEPLTYKSGALLTVLRSPACHAEPRYIWGKRDGHFESLPVTLDVKYTPSVAVVLWRRESAI